MLYIARTLQVVVNALPGGSVPLFNSFPKPDEAVNGWSLNGAKLRDFACVVFGLSGFPSRKENGLISSRFLREKQND
jgi:hypothetical protein